MKLRAGLVAWVAGLALGMGFGGDARAERDVDDLEELLPHATSALDLERWKGPSSRPLLRADSPPAAPIRNCAEWEPVTGVLVRYPLGVPYALLRDLDDVVTLHVVVSAGFASAAGASFVANGVDTSRVQWLVKPNDSIWTRDYGPWFVFDGAGDVAIVDHVYNRPLRPNDDLIPVELGLQLGVPVHRHGMWHTGGNYMTDGAGWSMSTDLVYDEAAAANGMSAPDVDQLMADWYGIADYEVVDDIESGGIHHIDTWGKFLDEETVLIKRVWPAHATWATLEQRATLIASLPASTGRNYRVFRVDCHDIGGGKPASYTNSLFVNARVCVPLFNHAVNDTAALGAYRAALPGYDVRGYTYAPWLTDDALHCRTMGVADRFMLRVAHVPQRDAAMGPLTMSAFVDDRSEAGVTSVMLRYRLDGGSWVAAPMTPSGDDYHAAIPATPADASVDYCIVAEDATGRSAGMPRSAPLGWYTFLLQANPASGAPVVARVSDGALAPNPFRGRTVLSFELRFEDHVHVAVHDVAGRLIRVVCDEARAAGRHEIAWDGRDERGHRVAGGVYYVRLRAAGLAYSRPVVLAR